jgi:hypothetical protein
LSFFTVIVIIGKERLWALIFLLRC